MRHVAAHLEPECTPDEFWRTFTDTVGEDGGGGLGGEGGGGGEGGEGGEGDGGCKSVEPNECDEHSEPYEHGKHDERSSDERCAECPSAATPRVSALIGLHTCGNLGPTMIRVFHHAGTPRPAAAPRWMHERPPA